MSKLNQGRFELKLKFGQLPSGKLIKADMYHEDQLCTGYAVDVTLPTKITLVVHGKDQKRDTILDHEGNILHDLYVKVVGVYLDGFDLGEEFLHKKLKFITDDGILTKPYIGFNGRLEFDLDQSTVFDQVLAWKNVVEKQQIVWKRNENRLT